MSVFVVDCFEFFFSAFRVSSRRNGPVIVEVVLLTFKGKNLMRAGNNRTSAREIRGRDVSWLEN